MSLDYSKQYFVTHDLGLAAAVSLFYPLELIDRTNPNKALFSFRRDEGLDELVQLYWKGELKGNLLAYFGQIKIIKTRLYEQGGRP